MARRPGPLDRTRAFPIHLAMRGAAAFLFALVFTAQLVYYVQQVRLDPLQMVLVGTILEGTSLLCEIPTGVLADLKSRGLSVMIGYALIGCGFVVEGAVARFRAVAGPAMGAVGRRAPVPAALTMSALLLVPTVPLLAQALRAPGGAERRER